MTRYLSRTVNNDKRTCERVYDPRNNTKTHELTLTVVCFGVHFVLLGSCPFVDHEFSGPRIHIG
jgi:hypothetical protein